MSTRALNERSQNEISLDDLKGNLGMLLLYLHQTLMCHTVRCVSLISVASQLEIVGNLVCIPYSNRQVLRQSKNFILVSDS